MRLQPALAAMALIRDLTYCTFATCRRRPLAGRDSLGLGSALQRLGPSFKSIPAS